MSLEATVSPLRLRAARIVVDDLAAARRFYGDWLALPLLAELADAYCVFDAGIDLVVERAGDAEADALCGRFTGLSFAVDDIEVTTRQLAARGVRIVAPPELQAWGGRLASIADPAGNTLQLVQYPTG